MSKATRTNISIPQELKARMDAVDEPVNWSAVACDAFRQKLAEIIKRKGAKDVKDVIERLRASKQKSRSTTYTHGANLGEMWAKHHAETVQLERLEEFHDTIKADHGDLETWFELPPMAPWTHAGLVVKALNGFDEDNMLMGELDELVGEIMGADAEKDIDFVRGWTDGVLNLWYSVQGEI